LNFKMAPQIARIMLIKRDAERPRRAGFLIESSNLSDTFYRRKKK
jgi:hypothetical protein